MKTTHSVRLNPDHLPLIKQFQSKRDLRSIQVAHDRILEAGLKRFGLIPAESEVADHLPKIIRTQGR